MLPVRGGLDIARRSAAIGGPKPEDPRMKRTGTFVAAALTASVVGVVALAGGARAGDEPAAPPGMPSFQKKVDHPLVKALVGDWAFVHKSTFGESAGTVTYALGVGDTAVLQDYEVSMGPMGSFNGHSIWKVSDDGKTLQAWWIDAMSAEPAHFKGALTDKGFDVKAANGTRLTMAQTATGFESKLFMPDGTEFFTDVMTKK
jgi:hypothetical protein